MSTPEKFAELCAWVALSAFLASRATHAAWADGVRVIQETTKQKWREAHSAEPGAQS